MRALWTSIVLGSLVAAPGSAASPGVNELSVRPAGGEGEWIELVDADGTSGGSLEGWSLRDATGRGRRLPAGARFGAGGFLVLAARPDSLRLHFALPESVSVVAPEGWPILNDRDAGPGLPADVVVLVDGAGIVRDSVAYFESWLPPAGGRSLERISPEALSTSAASWGWSLDPRGATPGRANSLAGDPREVEGVWEGPDRVALERGSPPFHYRLPGPGRLGVWLLDLEGREIAMLQAPEAVPALGAWVWGPGLPRPAGAGAYLLCIRWHGGELRLRRCKPVWVEP